ncbi:MAG: hypothetical protein IJ341_02425 [Bacteroidales bacterium]|nr:hypothetical protein [Bacteroidales bacterium]
MANNNYEIYVIEWAEHIGYKLKDNNILVDKKSGREFDLSDFEEWLNLYIECMLEDDMTFEEAKSTFFYEYSADSLRFEFEFSLDLNNGKYVFDNRRVMSCKLDNGFNVDVETVKINFEDFVSLYLWHKDYGIKWLIVSIPIKEITGTDNPYDLQFHQVDLRKVIDTQIKQFDSINDYLVQFADYKIV